MKQYTILCELNDGKKFTIEVVNSSKNKACSFVAGLFSNYSKLNGHKYTVVSSNSKKELIDSMKEVIRISDRNHSAWHRAKIAIENASTSNH